MYILSDIRKEILQFNNEDNESGLAVVTNELKKTKGAPHCW